MRVPMTCLLAVAGLLAFAPVQAQMDFDETHQVRIAFGDIPSTNTVEDDGVWNLRSTFIVPVDTQVNFTLPAGHAFNGAGCTDCTTTGVDGSTAPTYTTTCTSSSAGDCQVHFFHKAGGSTAFGTSFVLPADALVVLYTPNGVDALSNRAADLELACTNDASGTSPCTIRTFRPDAGVFWFVAAPTDLQPTTTVVDPVDGGVDGGTVVWAGLTGLVVGIVLWYLLVAQGVVQKRQRKQIAGESAHTAAAKAEGRLTLEGRKRVLMAALKELEVAKMNKEMDTAVYDALKADFKKQTVTTMRALEESG